MTDTQIVHAGLTVPAVSTAFASFLGFLPPLAAFVSVVWIVVQAYFFLKDRKNK